MKRKSILHFAAILIFLLAGCARTDFNQTTSTGAIENAFAASGLQICPQADIPSVANLGVEKGQFYQLHTDCTQFNPNNPGALVWALEFDSLAARNAALRRLSSEWRRGLGHTYIWTAGPYLIMIDGPRLTGIESSLKQAVMSLGAQ